MKALDNLIAAWAKTFRSDMDLRTIEMIRMARFDLYYGPLYERPDTDQWAHLTTRESQGFTVPWPGFEAACDEIREALEDLPSKLYFDVDAEYWAEDPPTLIGTCPQCDGEGCDNCNHTGEVEDYDYECYEIQRADLIKELVGKELVEYV